MKKTSTIMACVYTGPWTNPTGTTTYYHDITFENGDSGSCGTAEQNAAKISAGAIVEYTISDKGKIKLLSSSKHTGSSATAKASKAQHAGKSYQKYGGPKRHDEFLGYVWGYAKDLIIAGKTMNDVEELTKVARHIYAEVGKMLNEPES